MNISNLSFPKRPIFFAGKLSMEQELLGKQIGKEIFNGKLDDLSFFELSDPESLEEWAENKKQIIARWDFAKGIPTIQISDLGHLQLHGYLENLPTRGRHSRLGNCARRGVP